MHIDVSQEMVRRSSCHHIGNVRPLLQLTQFLSERTQFCSADSADEKQSAKGVGIRQGRSGAKKWPGNLLPDWPI